MVAGALQRQVFSSFMRVIFFLCLFLTAFAAPGVEKLILQRQSPLSMMAWVSVDGKGWKTNYENFNVTRVAPGRYCLLTPASMGFAFATLEMNDASVAGSTVMTDVDGSVFTGCSFLSEEPHISVHTFDKTAAYADRAFFVFVSH